MKIPVVSSRAAGSDMPGLAFFLLRPYRAYRTADAYLCPSPRIFCRAEAISISGFSSDSLFITIN